MKINLKKAFVFMLIYPSSFYIIHSFISWYVFFYECSLQQHLSPFLFLLFCFLARHHLWSTLYCILLCDTWYSLLNELRYESGTQIQSGIIFYVYLCLQGFDLLMQLYHFVLVSHRMKSSLWSSFSCCHRRARWRYRDLHHLPDRVC